MGRDILTFKNDCLVVDWVSFKFQDLDSLAQTRLAEYFYTLGFNSCRAYGKLAEPIKEPIFVRWGFQQAIAFS
jgi:hypothetical protein